MTEEKRSRRKKTASDESNRDSEVRRKSSGRIEVPVTLPFEFYQCDATVDKSKSALKFSVSCKGVKRKHRPSGGWISWYSMFLEKFSYL
jgi:hypothetical protein